LWRLIDGLMDGLIDGLVRHGTTFVVRRSSCE
jgi:hypothetical protein